MTAKRYRAANWTIRAQRIRETGTATNRARPKLLLGPKRGFLSPRSLFNSNSLIPTVLSEFSGPLPLLGELKQRIARLRALSSLKSESGGGRSTTRRQAGSSSCARWLGDARQLAGLLVTLLLAGEERREQAVSRVIYVASGKGTRPRASLVSRLAILLVMVLSPRVASAQTEGVATPTQMFDPENSPGIPVGHTLILRNETVLQARRDSNIYNVATDKTADTIALIDSNFRLGTNSLRHAAQLSAGFALQRYGKTTAENTSTYFADARTRLDLGERITVDADGGFARGYEMRGTAGDQFATDRPVLYNRKQIHARVARSGGILELALEGSVRTQDYLDAFSNGVRIDLGYRDATVRQGALEAQYRLSPAVRLYAELGANEVAYAQNVGYSRDSSGYNALAGVHLAVSSLVDVEAAAGYMRQTFKTPGTAPVSGISYKLAATWTPTPMWRLTASGSRNVDASPLSNVPAIVRSTFDLKAQRALGDRLLVEGGVTYTQESYRGLDRTDRRVEANVGVHYRLTSNVGALAQVGYRKQSGRASGRQYSGISGSVGLRFVL